MRTAKVQYNNTIFSPSPSGVGSGGDSKIFPALLNDYENEYRELTSQRQFEAALISLEDTFHECSKVNWDGYDATPIIDKAYNEAKKLLLLLPSPLPLPEIVPEATGEIGLEWYIARQFTFVISVGGNNVITFAGLFGEGNEVHGTEEFFEESIPPIIIDFISRLFPQHT